MVDIVQLHTGKSAFRFSNSLEGFLEILQPYPLLLSFVLRYTHFEVIFHMCVLSPHRFQTPHMQDPCSIPLFIAVETNIVCYLEEACSKCLLVKRVRHISCYKYERTGVSLTSVCQRTELGMTLVNAVTWKELWLLNVPEKHFNLFSLRCYSMCPRKCVIGNLPSVGSNVHHPCSPVEMLWTQGHSGLLFCCCLLKTYSPSLGMKFLL